MNQNSLTTDLPISYLLEDDPQAKDRLSFVLYATHEEISFGIGHKTEFPNSSKSILQLTPSLYPIQFRYENADKQCILGSFLNMCSIILTPEATFHIVRLTKTQDQHMAPRKHCVECLKILQMGYLVKTKLHESM